MKGKTIVVNPANIARIFAQAARKLDGVDNTKGRMLLLPKPYQVLNHRRYRGIGRPRKEDYDWKEYQWFKIFRQKLPNHPWFK